MLERYEKDFDENAFVKSFMERKQITTKRKALSELRKLIKKEGYYQSEIKETLKKKYPDAFVVKISQPWKRRPVFRINRYRKCNGKYRKSAHHRSHDAGNRARCHIREGVRIRR